MRIVITGGTGFLGRHLVSFLKTLGHEILLILRSDIMEGKDRISKLIKSSDVVINLAGSPVIKRWTGSNKREILSSRLHTTSLLIETVNELNPEDRPSLFLSASAIGIYDSINFHTERSGNFDENFLAEVCKRWEASLDPICGTNTRLCIMRIGIVLGRDGGMLKKLIPLFKAGLGGKIGTGKQSLSFIHCHDFCRSIAYLIENQSCSGVYNLTAPGITTNAEFTRLLASACHRPAFFSVPKMALNLLYGKAAVALTSGQSVYPQHLLDDGFKFQYPNLDVAIEEIIPT